MAGRPNGKEREQQEEEIVAIKHEIISIKSRLGRMDQQVGLDALIPGFKVMSTKVGQSVLDISHRQMGRRMSAREQEVLVLQAIDHLYDGMVEAARWLGLTVVGSPAFTSGILEKLAMLKQLQDEIQANSGQYPRSVHFVTEKILGQYTELVTGGLHPADALPRWQRLLAGAQTIEATCKLILDPANEQKRNR